MRVLVLFLPLFLLASNIIIPIPQTIKYNKAKALLGKKLFFDTKISADGTISCASCHNPKYGGADPSIVSVGVYAQLGDIQSPTVYNAVFNFRQFWNGRAKNLYAQIDGPIHNPVEMGLNSKKVEKIINSDKTYRKLFYKIYHAKYATYNMFKDAIVEFETALITPNAKFDKYLRGEIKLTKKELKGYKYFKTLGCINCHNGINIGGNSFGKIGVIHKIEDNSDDRYSITHNELDKFTYKVPTLRNIALTAPYFHDGLTYSLSEAVDHMAYFNLGIKLNKEENEAIVAFLKTLTAPKPAILEETNEK